MEKLYITFGILMLISFLMIVVSVVMLIWTSSTVLSFQILFTAMIATIVFASLANAIHGITEDKED